MYTAITDNTGTGSCVVSIEGAGPDFTAPDDMQVVPDAIRGLAGFLIDTCANQGQGIGGFVTYGLAYAYGMIATVPEAVGPTYCTP